MITALILLASGFAAEAPSWKEVRQANLRRSGPRLRGPAAVAGIQIHAFATGPRTTPDGEPAPVPDLPAPATWLPGAQATAAATLTGLGTTFGTPITGAGDTVTEPIFHPAGPERAEALRTALAHAPDASEVIVLQLSVGHCPTDSGWVACVRSADTALGAGPPAIEGLIVSRRRQTRSGAVRGRSSVVWTPFRYVSTGEKRWIDQPFLGEGSTFDEQAASAVAKATTAWAATAVGQRAVRRARKR